MGTEGRKGIRFQQSQLKQAWRGDWYDAAHLGIGYGLICRLSGLIVIDSGNRALEVRVSERSKSCDVADRDDRTRADGECLYSSYMSLRNECAEPCCIST